MKTRWLAIAAAAAMLGAPGAQAQKPGAGIAYVYPAGGRRGTTFQVTVGGQRLVEVRQARFTGRGIRAKIVDTVQPPKQETFAEHRDELRELARRKMAALRPGKPPAGKAWTDEDEDRLTGLIEESAVFARFREAPAFAERVVLEVTVDSDAAPGRRELRLETALGLTNPMVFMIGDFPEVSKPPLTARAVVAAVGEQRFAQWRRFLAPDEPTLDVALPAVINGQVGPGERDVFRFSARRGQRICVAVSARELMPYLADAVPGWFDAVVFLADAQGRELAAADHWRFHPDPMLCCEIPRDGRYVLEIRDSIYRGREDFVYRIAIGELPVVTDIFPLGGPAGRATEVALRGWNLPRAVLPMPGDLPPGLHPIGRDGLSGLFSPVARFAVDTLPECLEAASRSGAQEVQLPVIVNGRILRAGETDVFAFHGRAGQTVVAEVMARRLGSPLDSVLRVTDAAARTLATNDDHEDKGAGLVTHHADSRVSVTLPADGEYRVHLADIQGKAGEAYAYRLRLSEARPDFELRVTPSSLGIRRGATMAFTAHALRRDGFDGEIALALKDAPPGFVLGGGRIPAGQNQARMTLSAPRTAAPGPVELSFEGSAEIGGRRAARPAVPAEDMMQAFAWRFLVPTETFTVLVAEGQGRSALLADRIEPVRIPVGGSVSVPLNAPVNVPQGAIHFELNDPPKGISATNRVSRGGRADLVLLAAADASAGLQGNLIVDIILERTVMPSDSRGSAQQGAAQKSASARAAPTAKASETGPGASPAPKPVPQVRRVTIGTLPAILFEILKPD